ncbi:MAG TPA: TIGR00645 family protein, partial [Hyphomonadaceae bacterium]|nr:TIGR00645 family protein [Hyphomonadaceae bacterium]
PGQAGRYQRGMERFLESWLFRSRWLMAPFYVGLVLVLGVLLVVFFQEIFEEIPLLWKIDEAGHFAMREEEAIVLALSLIDISLAGNLVLIVIFAGYENFVSKMDVARQEDRPEWMGHVDFSGLKLKLVASIVAISGISVLKNMLKVGELDVIDATSNAKLMWLLLVHITFVVSGVLLALMDWLVARQNPR